MDITSTIDFSRIAFCILSALFAIHFIRMYKRDKDKRKIMGAISFIFLAFSAGLQIIPLSSIYYFIANFVALDFFPITITALSLLYYEIRHRNIVNSIQPFYIFIFALLVMIFIPIDLSQITMTVNVLGLIALFLSLFLFFKNRQFGTILISLAIASYLAHGLGWAFNMGMPFIALCYVLGFVFVALAFSLLQTDDQSGFSSFFKVNRELDKTQHRLRELKIEYKTVFESVNDAIFVINAKTNQILDCNREATKLLDQVKEEILGKSLATIFVHAENEKDFQLILNDDNQNGSEIIEKQIKTGKGEFREVAIKIGTFIHENDKIVVTVLRDITEQKRNAATLSLAFKSLTEKTKSIQVLNEKILVIGSLTRHDVGNKLMVARSNLYLLKRKTSNDTELTKFINVIEDALIQSAKIFEFSKKYETSSSEKLTESDLAKQFDEAIKLIPLTNVEVTNKTQGVSVLADTMLQQLFYTLIDNSLKHGKKVNKIQLSTILNDKESKIIYEDNGVGIPKENKEKIFSEGFTTGGSGLGLKLAKRIVEVYGWTIQEIGEPGKGAKFAITIPKLNSIGKENYPITQ